MLQIYNLPIIGNFCPIYNFLLNLKMNPSYSNGNTWSLSLPPASASIIAGRSDQVFWEIVTVYSVRHTRQKYYANVEKQHFVSTWTGCIYPSAFYIFNNNSQVNNKVHSRARANNNTELWDRAKLTTELRPVRCGVKLIFIL